MISDNYKIYEEMNDVLTLREMEGPATLIRVLWGAVSAEFFYINLLKPGYMIEGNCKCVKIDKHGRTDLVRYEFKGSHFYPRPLEVEWGELAIQLEYVSLKVFYAL